MKSALFLFLLVFVTTGRCNPLTLAEAAAAGTPRLEFKSNGGDRLTIIATNRGTAQVTLSIPAGLLFTDKNGAQKIVVLRPATLPIAPGTAAEAIVATVALSIRNTFTPAPCILSDQTAPRLASLIAYAAKNPDLPTQTTQLVALCLVEDIRFGEWQKFLAPRRAAALPSEIVEAIDALGILREIVPGERPALGEDPELKLRALRNPVSRGKAMGLYGMSLKGEAAEGMAPNLGQLLHKVPGDNCPVCQARAKGEPSPNGL